MGTAESKTPVDAKALSFWEKLQKKVFLLVPKKLYQTNLKGSKVLFVGNPGAGKSTLLNSIIQSCKFKSGVTNGVGLTTTLQPCVVGGIEFIDTPGLSDVKMREKAAEEISQALKRNGVYYLFFVVTLESGRVRPDDLTTMKLVLDALCNVPHLSFGIIVNKVTKNMILRLKDLNNFKEMMAILNTGLPLSTTNIFFHPLEDSAQDADNILLPHNYELENFICSSTSVTIQCEFVDPLKIDLFEDFKAAMEAETKKLREDNAKLQQEIARLENEHDEKIRTLEEQISFLLSKMTTVDRVEVEPKNRNLNDMVDLHLDRPLSSFNEAIRFLEQEIPGIENFGLICTYFASNIDKNEKQNLTDDEISAINLYTRESDPRENSLYFVLNKAFREQDRTALKPFFPYLHLLLCAMCKLPKCPPGTVLWRGVQKNISSEYTKGKKVIWWGLSSCSKSMETLDNFFIQERERTLFSVQVNSAIEISQFSSFPREEEVLVFPCVTFEVQSVYSPSGGLWIVQMKEIFSPTKLIVGFDNLGN